MSKFDPRTVPPPTPENIKQVDFVMAELKPGKVSIGWRFNGQDTVHLFYFNLSPDEAAQTMKQIIDKQITDKDIARLDWQAVYLPIRESRKQQ